MYVNLWIYLSFLCICFADINECCSDPCLNGGSCEDDVNGFCCECPPGFTGECCETGKDFGCLKLPEDVH